MILSDQSIQDLCTKKILLGDGTGLYYSDYVDFTNATIGQEGRIVDRISCPKPMIDPFIDHSVREVNGEKVVSYGLSSAGYDIRLAPEFKTFTKPNDGRVIDVKKPDNESLVCEHVEAETIVIPPGGLVLSRTVEYFTIPRRVLAVCMGKSTWARAGALINITPAEPEWEGHLVVEITNGSQLPLKIYANEGIAQMVFYAIDRDPQVSYADRGGKYQGQDSIVGSRM